MKVLEHAEKTDNSNGKTGMERMKKRVFKKKF